MSTEKNVGVKISKTADFYWINDVNLSWKIHSWTHYTS